MRRHVLDWYHFNLNHPPGGSRLAINTWEVFYQKGLVIQANLYVNPCKICQQFKKRNNTNGCLPPNNTTELKPWNAVHVDLIGPYRKSTIQQNPVGTFIKNNYSLTCMTIIDPAMGWFEIFEVPTFELDEVTGGND